jgi:hypothetical protein
MRMDLRDEIGKRIALHGKKLSRCPAIEARDSETGLKLSRAAQIHWVTEAILAGLLQFTT